VEARPATRMTADPVPRLRMFAGPNGSGKTTVKNHLNKPASWFGLYINPDDLEAAIRRDGVLPLESFGLSFGTDEVRAYFTDSPFLRSQNLHGTAHTIVRAGDILDFRGVPFTSYHASVLSDFLRRQAIAAGRSFTFETVMSAPDKVRLLEEARTHGYRTYLYFIATIDPLINVQRVRNRVASGGHHVPEAKIVERYYRSIGLLHEALRYTSRAFLFDTSQEGPWYFAEVTEGTYVALKLDDAYPSWFEPVLKALNVGPAGSA
jgi:predicted ABC-type ATPase